MNLSHIGLLLVIIGAAVAVGWALNYEPPLNNLRAFLPANSLVPLLAAATVIVIGLVIVGWAE